MEEFLKKNGTNIAIGLVVAVVIYFMFFNTEGFISKCTQADGTYDKDKNPTKICVGGWWSDLVDGDNTSCTNFKNTTLNNCKINTKTCKQKKNGNYACQ